MPKEAEDRGLADYNFFLDQASLKFRQRDVRLRFYPPLDLTPIRFQGIAFVAAELLVTNASDVSPTCEKSTDRTDAHASELGRLLIRVARLNRVYNAPQQVFRVWLPHSCWPPVQWAA